MPNHISSDKYPIINQLLSYYQVSLNMRETGAGPFRLNQGLTDEETSARVLIKQNLSEILHDSTDNYITSCALQIKSDFLFGFIEAQLGAGVFDDFLSEFLSKNRFDTVNDEEFFKLFEMRFGFKLERFIDEWINEKRLPKYFITNYNLTEINDAEKTKYQIVFTAHNAEDVNGVISVGIAGPDAHRRFITIDGNETKIIGMVLENWPMGLIVNTIVSQNIPLYFQKQLSLSETGVNSELFEGECVVDYPPKLNEYGEIIVDNEDSGFEIITQPEESYFMKLLNKHNEQKLEDEEYAGLNLLNIPTNWRNCTSNNNYYGIYVKSAHIIKSGNGKYKVQWQAEIPESGEYDIYYHIPFTEIEILNINEYNTYNDLNFVIYYDIGVDDINIDITNTKPGWTLLGTYTLSKGNSRIELSDKSTGKVVFADAVKWVKKD